MRFANAAGAHVAGELACSDAMPTEAEVERKLQEARLKEDRLRSDELAELARTRLMDPAAMRKAADARKRAASPVGPSGKCFIIAADHPARGALGTGGDPMAMADRGDLLDRLRIALENPGCNGVLATADILEDLLLLGALDGKVVFGSMNRGGLAGAVVRDRRPVHRHERRIDRAHGLRRRQDAHPHRLRRRPAPRPRSKRPRTRSTRSPTTA